MSMTQTTTTHRFLRREFKDGTIAVHVERADGTPCGMMSTATNDRWTTSRELQRELGRSGWNLDPMDADSATARLIKSLSCRAGTALVTRRAAA